jgi:type IV secretory pathway VirB10-like protein
MVLAVVACGGALAYLYVQSRSDRPPPVIHEAPTTPTPTPAPTPGERVYPPTPVPVAPGAPKVADTPARRSEVPQEEGLRGYWTREYADWKREAGLDSGQETALVQALGKATTAFVAADKLPKSGPDDETRLDAMADAAQAFAAEVQRVLTPEQRASFERKFSDGVILIRAQIVEP